MKAYGHMQKRDLSWNQPAGKSNFGQDLLLLPVRPFLTYVSADRALVLNTSLPRNPHEQREALQRPLVIPQSKIDYLSSFGKTLPRKRGCYEDAQVLL